MNLEDFLTPQFLGSSVVSLFLVWITARFFPQEAKLSVDKFYLPDPSAASLALDIAKIQIVCRNSGRKNIENREVIVWTTSGEILKNDVLMPSVENWAHKLDSGGKRLTIKIDCLKPKEGFAINMAIRAGDIGNIKVDSRSELKVSDGSPSGDSFQQHFKIFRTIMAVMSLATGLIFFQITSKIAEQLTAHPQAFGMALWTFIFGMGAYSTGFIMLVLELPWKAMKEALIAESKSS